MRSTLFLITTGTTASRREKRDRRAKSKEMVALDVISPDQNVPVILENFYSSFTSESAFQAFYAEWLTTNYCDSKPISPQAWMVSDGCASVLPQLNCTHEKADDRVMFHICRTCQDLHP